MILEEHLGLIAPGLTFGAMAVATVWLFLRKQRVVALLVGTVSLLLLANAIPSLRPARPIAQRNACIADLDWINRAKVDWAERFPESVGTELTVEQLAGTNRFLRQFPTCPGGGIHTIGKPGEPPTCSLAAKGHVWASSVKKP